VAASRTTMGGRPGPGNIVEDEREGEADAGV